MTKTNLKILILRFCKGKGHYVAWH